MIDHIKTFGAVFALAIAGGCQQEPDTTEAPEVAPTTEFDTPGATKTSAGGGYKITLGPLADPVPLRRIHQWRVSVSDATDNPATTVRLTLAGGMPDHDHGFPTTPVIEGPGAPGVFVVDGVKFNMSGWWQFRFDIHDGERVDSVTFNYRIEE